MGTATHLSTAADCPDDEGKKKPHRSPCPMLFSVRQQGLQRRVDRVRDHELDEPQGQLLGQRVQRDTVRLAEGGAAAQPTLRDPAPGEGRNHRVAALVQPNTTTLDAGLCQPDAVRAKLVCSSGQASQFVTQLWDTNSEGKVSQ